MMREKQLVKYQRIPIAFASDLDPTADANGLFKPEMNDEGFRKKIIDQINNLELPEKCVFILMTKLQQSKEGVDQYVDEYKKFLVMGACCKGNISPSE